MHARRTYFEQVSVDEVKKIAEDYAAGGKASENGEASAESFPSRTGGGVPACGTRGTEFEVEPENEDEATGPFEYPEWQKPVQEALLELDNDKLKERIEAAEVAILNRLQSLSRTQCSEAERLAIQDALSTLRVVKRDCLRFPDWENEPSKGALP